MKYAVPLSPPGTKVSRAGTSTYMRKRTRATRSREVDRYKKAATDALRLLDWCIEYLADNREGKIASQLARNRAHIRDRLGDRSGS